MDRRADGEVCAGLVEFADGAQDHKAGGNADADFDGLTAGRGYFSQGLDDGKPARNGFLRISALCLL